MKKYFLIVTVIILSFSSCSEFLTLQPEYLINENNYYNTANDFETALIGNYSELQRLHNFLLYLLDLTTDNANIQWTSPTTSESECDEMNITPTNGFLNTVWRSCFSTVSRCNNILSRIEDVDFEESLKEQYKGEVLFLRAYCYFYMVRFFGDLPIVEVAFRSPDEIADFDMTKQPVSDVYQLIIDDLDASAELLDGVTGLSKSRASAGAAKTLLGKVYLTRKEYALASTVLKEVIDMDYSLEADYGVLFTNGNDELSESIFEIKYLSGNIDEGNSFSSIFMPPLFNMAMFPGDMQGSGRITPTGNMRDAYETDGVRRALSVGDSVLLKDETWENHLHGLKFVDFTTGLPGDGGINFTSLRFADVLLMYSEALIETDNSTEAHTYINLVRDRAGLADLSGLSKSDFAIALENERRVEFLHEGHRWFDLIRTGRAQTVINKYFEDIGLSFSLDDHELLMPIPQAEIDIDPNLKQNPGY